MKPLSLFTNAVRAKEIVTVLVRYGFEDLVGQLDSSGLLRRLVSPRTEGLNNWQRIRMVCEDLGPTYVKIAQLLSTRPDVLPQPLIEELKKLRSHVRPVDFESIKTVLDVELDSRIEDFFTEFSETPAAAGSLAQVHRARLKGTGKEVAVKIQRPDIKKEILADLRIIGWLAHEIHERFDEVKPFDLPEVVEETKIGLLRELDFNNEARYATLFNSLNPFPDEIFAPEVIEEFTTRRLMVTAWVDGKSPDEMDLNPEQGRKLATVGGKSIFHQIVIDGFFHADPHSGNMLITEDLRICLIDWGLAGLLTKEMRYFLADLFVAVASQNPEKVVMVASRMASSEKRVNRLEMEKEVTYLLRKYPQLTAVKESIGKILINLLYIFGSNGIHVMRDYTLLARAVIAIEETGKSLDPEFEIPKLAAPFIEQLNWERWNPKTVVSQFYYKLADSLKRINDLPGDLQRVLRRFEDGDLKLQLHHRGLEEHDKFVTHAANRIALGVVIGALIIGSSLVITTGVQPHLWGFPAIGIIGYLLSALLGLGVVIDILRSKLH